MSTWKLVRLKFGRGGVHLGGLGIGLEEAHERVHSDTLFSAWLSAYARLVDKEKVETLVKDVQEPVPLFRMSSTFVYQEFNGKTVEYLPRPLKFPKCYPVGDDFEFAKTFKKLRYLPRDVWQRWYQGDGFNDSDRIELIDATHKQFSGDLSKAGTFAYSQAFRIEQHPKVAIDRTTRATNFYHTGMVGYRWEFQQGNIESLSGLYFLVEFPAADSEFMQTFFAVLEFLGSEGIGGERSSGAGQFTPEVLELDSTWRGITQFSGSTQHCLVSLFWKPEIASALLSQASYELQERGGWITSPSAGNMQQRRQSLKMFTEGSVFSDFPSGELANVTPRQGTKHPIYRSGIALSFPIQGQEL